MEKRTTKQKKILGEALGQSKEFFGAQDLLSRVRTKGIGIATVYRYLKDMEDQGKLHAYVCDEKKIYSSNAKNHVHFRCEHCGSIEHVRPRKLDFLREIEGDICHISIDISGVCKKCKERIT